MIIEALNQISLDSTNLRINFKSCIFVFFMVDAKKGQF